MLRIVGDLGQQSAVDTFREPLTNLTSAGGAGAVLSIGVIGALWSASGYLGAFTRAGNVVYSAEESRAFWKLRPQQVGMTLLMVLLLSPCCSSASSSQGPSPARSATSSVSAAPP